VNGTAKSRIGPILLLIILCLSNLLLVDCNNIDEPEIISISPPEISAPYLEIDNYIKRQMETDDIPGLAVVIVQGEEVVYCKGFGIASITTGSPVTTQTIFDLASVSKSFTAIGVLLLRDDGLIDLDAPVQQYLPDFQPNDPLASHITIRQLLDHTSGLPGAFSAPLIFQQGDDEMAKLVTALGRVRLNREPGSSFEYADVNYCLLGALIERVSGTTFEDYMDQNIFIPLGMSNTILYLDENTVLDRAEGHQSMYGQVVTRHIPIYRSAQPAGWIMSCAEDMGRWLIVHLNGGYTSERQVIPAADIEEVHSLSILIKENREEIGYGMGWFISSVDDVLLIWHGGDTPNFMADMILLPDYETGVVVLVNSQACTTGHDIATSVVNYILGLELEPMEVPWWAHWKAIDTLASIVLAFVIFVGLALIFYVWYIWLQIRAKKRFFIGSLMVGRKPPTWQLVFYVIPLVLYSMFTLAGYLVVKTLYGYNLFEVLFLFRLGSPPGVYISGVSLLIITFLWALLLAFTGIFTRKSKDKA
jgi:CubicO group peptidase (beta-lactamase class C family)